MSAPNEPSERPRHPRAIGAAAAGDRLADLLRRIAEGELDTRLASLETAAGLLDAGPPLLGESVPDPA